MSVFRDSLKSFHLFYRTPEEMIITRSKLRKVNITRSPGGTPLVSNRNKENGTGLTPMMTKALCSYHGLSEPIRKLENHYPELKIY